MKYIHKAVINEIGIPQFIEGIPKYFSMQNGILTVWYETSSIGTIVCVYGTGWDIPDNSKYIGTVITSHLVWHCYYEIQ